MEWIAVQAPSSHGNRSLGRIRDISSRRDLRFLLWTMYCDRSKKTLKNKQKNKFARLGSYFSCMIKYLLLLIHMFVLQAHPLPRSTTSSTWSTRLASQKTFSPGEWVNHLTRLPRISIVFNTNLPRNILKPQTLSLCAAPVDCLSETSGPQGSSSRWLSALELTRIEQIVIGREEKRKRKGRIGLIHRSCSFLIISPCSQWANL